ncbi:hypothetical protein ACFP3Q_08540 [Nocardioides sp. GCM10027113]|uniref:hypothetical protein n=1 Tax=unclassified Nocardioides TaxID=2615069 RepID=UPI00360700BF
MRGRGLQGRLALPVVAVLAAAGCTGSPGPVGTAGSGQPDGDATSLQWSRVRGPVDATVTTGGGWTLTVDPSGTRATLDGADPVTVTAPDRFRVADALLDDGWALVTVQDRLEERPMVATVVDLDSGEQFTLDGDSDVPTTTGGSWALGDGTASHATVSPDGGWCVATVDLASRTSQRRWCAPPRTGFNGVSVTPDGTTMLTFDDQRPSCRTPVRLDGDDVDPIGGVEPCLGWDAVALPGAVVWSETPRPTRVEQAVLRARTGDGAVVDLGPGTSGTLVRCGEAAYFVRDPQRDGQPAALLRWAPGDDEAGVVYESPGGGPAFLAEPRCGGDALTLTVLAASGDRQVTALLP